MDNFRIDSHKLIFHAERVADWLRAKAVYPIYLEIAPAGGCNHRCIFCALDYLGYKPKFLDPKVLERAIREAGALGIKSVMYAGEGEPLLHKDICEIIQYTKRAGIDAAITTNGVLLTKDMSRKVLGLLSWVRVSLNAGRSKTYAKIHQTSEKDFHKVLKNLEDAVRINKKNRLKTTIGVQLLLIPENAGEVLILAKTLRKIGVDYFTVKPYSQHPLSRKRMDKAFKYEEYDYLYEELEKIKNRRFNIIFRKNTMERIGSAKDYKHCLGMPFWSYIDASGDVYACSAFLGKKEFCCGNIYRNGFKDIMDGRRRKKIIDKVALKLDVSGCRPACRMDKVNSYLWELKHPGPHVNFI